MAGWFVAVTVGTLGTRTTNSRQGPDHKLKKQRFVCCCSSRRQRAGRCSRRRPPCSRRGCSSSIRRIRHLRRIRPPKILVASRAAVGFAPNTRRGLWNCHSTDVTNSTKQPHRVCGTAYRAGFVESDLFVEFVIPTSPAGSRAALRRIAVDEFGYGFDGFGLMTTATSSPDRRLSRDARAGRPPSHPRSP